MRNFHYISESKLEMYASQAQRGRRIDASLEFAVPPILKVRIGSKEQDQYAKVETVEKRLMKDRAIGTIEDPKRWFQGKAVAIFTRVREESRAIFYFFRTPTAYVALGGSASHLISAGPSRKESFGVSYAADLVDSLCMLDAEPQLLGNEEEREARFLECGVSGNIRPWTGMIYGQCHRRRDKTFNFPIKFLALKLLEDRFNGKRVILGSPLYVEDP